MATNAPARTSKPEYPLAIRIVAGAAALVALALGLVWTYTAWAGGRLFLIGLETDGSVGLAALLLFVVVPFLVASAWYGVKEALAISWRK